MVGDMVIRLDWQILDGQRDTASTASEEVLVDVLGAIHSGAQGRGLPQLVNVSCVSWAQGFSGSATPPLQVILGHRERGCAVRRHGEQPWVAVQPLMPPLPEDIPYTDGVQVRTLSSEWARITPTDALRVAVVYLHTGLGSDAISWFPAGDVSFP